MNDIMLNLKEAAKLLGVHTSTAKKYLGSPDGKKHQLHLYRKSRALALKEEFEENGKPRRHNYGKNKGDAHRRRGESKIASVGLEEVTTVRYCKTRVCRAPGCTNHPRVNCLFCDKCGPKYQHMFEADGGSLG